MAAIPDDIRYSAVARHAVLNAERLKVAHTALLGWAVTVSPFSMVMTCH
jgi:hypothetical protein